MIDDLGKNDVNTNNHPRVRVLSDKARAAYLKLHELGNTAMPFIIERLQQIPELEQALMKQSDSEDYKRQMNWLQGRKANLVSLIGGSGDKSHGKILLSIADTKVGTSKIRAAGLVLALRQLGATTEEKIMLDRLFKDPDTYISGASSVLEYLSLMRSESDKALAGRLATWPLESKLKGRAVVLGTRLGLKEPMLAEIKAVLQRSEMRPDIQNREYELGLHLTALAELLPPDDYMAITTEAKILQHKGYQSMVSAAQHHNQFWWASTQEKDAQVHQLIRNDKCNNDVLALHYMLKNKRVDLLLKTRKIWDKNALKRQSQQSLEPYYEIGQVPPHRIPLTGYKFSTVDGKVIIEETPGYGMFN